MNKRLKRVLQCGIIVSLIIVLVLRNQTDVNAQVMKTTQSISDELESVSNNVTEGTIMTASGDYTGTIVDKTITGIGTLKYNNGKIYKGKFNNGSPNGNGIMTYPNGASYTGNFSSGLKSGTGELITTTGVKIKGSWDDDYLSGSAKVIYPNGDTYSGSYLKNKRNGSGKYIFYNKDVYTGHWSEDCFSGKGTYVFANGALYYSITWDKNLLNGTVMYKTSTGITYTTEWQYGDCISISPSYK
jgi:hypothetical protein